MIQVSEDLKKGENQGIAIFTLTYFLLIEKSVPERKNVFKHRTRML